NVVIAAVGHRDSFGKPLGFVIHGTRTDRIDVSPITLPLRMFQRGSVALGCGRYQVLRAIFLPDPESVERSERPAPPGVDSVKAIIDRTGGACEMEHVIDLARIEWITDIFLDELEARLIAQMFDIRDATRDQAVDDHNLPAFGEQRVGEMRSEKTGATGD